MATLSGSLIVNAKMEHANALDLATALLMLDEVYQADLSNGTGDDQVNELWHDERTIAASGTDTLDLAGALTSAFGATITFTKIKAIVVIADAGNTNDVVVGGASSNAFQGPFNATTHKINVQKGGAFVAIAPKTGWTVTAGTGDQFLIANGGGTTSVTYRIILIGTV
jgi:hypothetical protein